MLISYLGFNINFEIISSISVEVFFIISGFVLAPQIIKIIKSDTINTYKIFLFRRWYRTVPLYILSLILTSIILDNILTLDLLKYLFFLQNFTKIWVINDYFSIAWSLSVEEWFYIFFPLFLFFFFKFQKLDNSRIVYASFIFILIIFLIRVFLPNEENWGSDIRRIVLYRLDSIAFGFILFFFKDKLRPTIKNHFLLAVIFLFFSFFIFQTLKINAFEDIAFYKMSFHIFIAIWGSTIVLFCYLFDKKVKNQNIIKLNIFLGKLSYSIYLFHLLIIYIISIFNISLLLTMIIYLILQFIISILLYYYFEEPILKSRPNY